MSGADEVGRVGVWIDRELDGFGAFFGGDACGEPVLWVSVDGHGEGGRADGGVDDRLRREFESIAVGLGQREAHVPAGDGEHKRDGFGRDELGGQHKVALVLAVLVVGEDNHLALAEVFKDFLDGGECGVVGRLLFCVWHGGMVELVGGNSRIVGHEEMEDWLYWGAHCSWAVGLGYFFVERVCANWWYCSHPNTGRPCAD